jgi:serine/threonine protein phosphatase PrpC
LYWPEPDTEGNVNYPINSDLLRQRGYLFVVAHGSGTPPHGLEACRLGIQAVIKEFYENEPFRDVPIHLEAAIQVANQVVHDYTWLNFEEPILGNSMVVAVVKGNEVTIASIGGDAAGYLIRETNVQELVPLERSSLPADFYGFPYLVITVPL